MSRLFPLVPNWSEGLKQEYEFKTDIITSEDGTEQRRALRQTARQTVSFTSVADGDRLQAVARVMGAALGGTLALPDYTRSVYLTANLVIGAGHISVDSVPDWIDADVDIAVQWGRDIERLTVDHVTGTTVYFTSGAVAAWPAGARLRPVRDGRLLGGTTASLVTNRIGTIPISFSVSPGIYDQAPQDFDFDTGSFLNGREILTARPNWSQTPTIAFDWTVETIDYGFGRTAYDQTSAFGLRTQQATYLKKTADDVIYLRDFFLRQKGQRGEFYMPSWTDDLTLVSAVVGDDIITLAGRGIYDDYHLDPVHRAVMIRETGGFVHLREVSGISLVGGNSVLAVDTLALDINPSDVESISWLYVSRFASDSLTLEWTTDGIAQTVLSTSVLPAATAESALFSGLDGAALWLISSFGWKYTQNVLIEVVDLTVNGTWYAISTGGGMLGDNLDITLSQYIAMTRAVFPTMWQLITEQGEPMMTEDGFYLQVPL